MVKLRQSRPDPAKVYECTEAFGGHTEEGVAFNVNLGMRFRGDHSFVKRFPERFEEFGAPNHDRPQHAA
jgi:hypothetical protein